MEEKDDKGFTIRDKRTSSEGAEAKEPRAEPQAKEQRESAKQRPAETGGKKPEEEAPPFELDFPTFIISLATTAQMNMGNIANPHTNKAETNLPAAQQMIDIIVMLSEKTKGNLSKEEEGLIENVLYNLRMQYVKVAEKRP